MFGSLPVSLIFASIHTAGQRRASRKRLSPIVLLILFYLFFILLATLLLRLPIAQHPGAHLNWLNTLFTCVSTLTLTGLVTVNTADSWSRVGQAILLVLMQIGGIGYMMVATNIGIRLGVRLGTHERHELSETRTATYARRRFWTFIGLATLAIMLLEITGGVLLALRLHAITPSDGWSNALFTGIFYAVSAFCNAGLELAPGVGGLAASGLTDNLGTLSTLGVLSLLGSLGIAVLVGVTQRARGYRLSLQVKLVLSMTLLLLLLGTLMIALFEWHNPATLGGHALPGRWGSTVLLAITARGAGFSPFDLNALTPPSFFFLALLMLVGGAPGSTASGFKVTTLAVILLAIITLLRRRQDIEIFHRRISGEVVRLALSQACLYLFTLSLIILGITLTEITLRGIPASAETLRHFSRLVFETISAFSNVGLRTGITPTLTPASQLLLLLAMLLGRIGPLAFFYLFAQAKHPTLRRAPTEMVMSG